MADYKFGDVFVPDGKKGPWEVSTFTIKPPKDDIFTWMMNARSYRDDGGLMAVTPGTYKRLTHTSRGVIMSNTPMEIRTNVAAYRAATGRVLINGLGLGMLLEGILRKEDVTYVRVIEAEQNVIDLVGAHYKNPKLEIVLADAYEYRPQKGEVFNYVWHDIWDDLSSENFPLMAKLTRRYGRVADAQGVWSRDEVRRMERRA